MPEFSDTQSFSKEGIEKTIRDSFTMGYNCCLDDVKELLGEDKFSELNIGSNRSQVSVDVNIFNVKSKGEEA